jgi:DNA-directed RNA polymerase subunit M/transcription elongation factor TFIIS
LNEVLPYPDLVIDECPVSCDKCSAVYINKEISHKIICQCRKCEHNNNKYKALAEVVGPETNATLSLTQEQTQDDD